MVYFYKIQKGWEDDLLVNNEMSSSRSASGRNTIGFSYSFTVKEWIISKFFLKVLILARGNRLNSHSFSNHRKKTRFNVLQSESTLRCRNASVR